MDKKQIAHIAGEVVVIGGISYYFNKKIKDMKQHYDSKISELEKKITSLNKGMEQMVTLLDQVMPAIDVMRTMSPQQQMFLQAQQQQQQTQMMNRQEQQSHPQQQQQSQQRPSQQQNRQQQQRPQQRPPQQSAQQQQRPPQPQGKPVSKPVQKAQPVKQHISDNASVVDDIMVIDETITPVEAPQREQRESFNPLDELKNGAEQLVKNILNSGTFNIPVPDLVITLPVPMPFEEMQNQQRREEASQAANIQILNEEEEDRSYDSDIQEELEKLS